MGLVPEVAPGFPKRFCVKLSSGFRVPVVKKAAPVAKDVLTRVAADDCGETLGCEGGRGGRYLGLEWVAIMVCPLDLSPCPTFTWTFASQ